MIWRSVTIAMAAAGVVVLGILYAIGQWGCCGSEVSKPLTDDSTWVRPPNPWIVGQAATSGPAGKADHKTKSHNAASGENANPAGLLAALKPQGNHGPSQATGSPIGDTGQPETPLPPSGTGPPPANSTPSNNCSPVIAVLTGLASADCAQAGASDHSDSSSNHDSSGNGNHHSAHQGGSSDDATARPNDNSHGSDKDGQDSQGHDEHGDRGKSDEDHGRGHGAGKKHD